VKGQFSKDSSTTYGLVEGLRRIFQGQALKWLIGFVIRVRREAMRTSRREARLFLISPREHFSEQRFSAIKHLHSGSGA
jgi:hypothetical protein